MVPVCVHQGTGKEPKWPGKQVARLGSFGGRVYPERGWSTGLHSTATLTLTITHNDVRGIAGTATVRTHNIRGSIKVRTVLIATLPLLRGQRVLGALPSVVRGTRGEGHWAVVSLPRPGHGTTQVPCARHTVMPVLTVAAGVVVWVRLGNGPSTWFGVHGSTGVHGARQHEGDVGGEGRWHGQRLT